MIAEGAHAGADPFEQQEGSVFRYRFVTSSAVFAVIASAIAVAPAGVAASAGTRYISASGVTSFNSMASSGGRRVQQPELGPGLGEDSSAAGSRTNDVNRSRSIQHTAPPVTVVPVTAGEGVSSSGPLQVLSTFNGLNHRDQRLANGARQFSLEPPDQGLCVGNGVEMEIINDVMRVYAPNGAPLKGVEDLNTFFGFPAAFVRPNGPFGPFVTDPSCYYDKDLNR